MFEKKQRELIQVPDIFPILYKCNKFSVLYFLYWKRWPREFEFSSKQLEWTMTLPTIRNSTPTNSARLRAEKQEWIRGNKYENRYHGVATININLDEINGPDILAGRDQTHSSNGNLKWQDCYLSDAIQNEVLSYATKSMGAFEVFHRCVTGDTVNLSSIA